MSKPIYQDTKTYNFMIFKLTGLEPDPSTGYLNPDEVKIAMGEFGDIWPMNIKADSEKYNS